MPVGCFVKRRPSLHVRIFRNSPARPVPSKRKVSMPFRPRSKPSLTAAAAMAAALPRLSWSSQRHGGESGRGGARGAGGGERDVYARSLPTFVRLCRSRTGRGGRPIKYVDHGGVWRLRMRAAVARTAREARRKGSRERTERRREGRNRPASRKRRRVLGVRFVWCALPSR